MDSLLQRGYRYALALTHDAHRAEDLLQDAVVAVLARGRLEHLGYLLRTIRNRFIDMHRREGLVVMQPLEEAGDEAFAALDRADNAVDPERLAQGLGTLRAAEREALYLAAVEDWTAREIAELTGRPRNTVLSLVHRARAKLRAFFARHDEEARG